MEAMFELDKEKFDIQEDDGEPPNEGSPLEERAREKFEREVPRRFHAAVPIHDVLRRVLSGESDLSCAYLYGEPGTGKSHQLGCAIRHFLYQRIVVNQDIESSAAFVGETHLLDELKNCYDGEGSTFESVRNKYESADLLCLDDLGTASHSSWSRKELYRLINCRYERMKPTLFSSNYSISELAEEGNYDDRIISRIWEMVRFPSGAAELTNNYRIEG